VRKAWLIPCLLLAGCGGSSPKATPTPAQTPPIGQTASEAPAQGPPLGFPVFATKNTTRVPGGDAITDAAAIALATYPARTPETRPQVVVLADYNDWHTGLAAAQLASAPLKAPILFAQGDTVPPATQAALDALQPTGSKQAGGAQVIRVGTNANVGAYKTTDVTAANVPAMAAAIDRLHAAAAGATSGAIVLASQDHPEYAMPAAAWAAKSGDPVLWVTATGIPPETAAAIKTHKAAALYVLGPPESVPDTVLDQLGKLGTTKRIAGTDPVTNAITFARYQDGDFGWNIVDPGHGLVFANTRRPQDAGAAAALSAAGTYGPLLLLTDAGVLPAPLQNYLLDIQPGYDKASDPTRGVYSHGWIIGDETAIAAAVQARIDTLLEIQPVDTGSP
jgi:hypothetical protein